jgi:hypothetical protein
MSKNIPLNKISLNSSDKVKTVDRSNYTAYNLGGDYISPLVAYLLYYGGFSTSCSFISSDYSVAPSTLMNKLFNFSTLCNLETPIILQFSV